MKLLLWTFALGLGVYSQNSIEINWIMYLCLLLFAYWIWWKYNTQKSVALMLMMFVLGSISGKVSVSEPVLQASRKYVVDALVCSQPVTRDQHVVIQLCLENIESKDGSFAVDRTVKTTFFSTLFPQQGDLIRAKLKVTKSPYTQDLVGSVSRDKDWAWRARTKPTYQMKVNQKAKTLLPVESFQIYQAMILGDAGYLDVRLKQSLVNLGLIHLFVFSGFHVGVLFGLFYFLIGWVLALVPNAFLRKRIQGLFAWLAVTMFLYGFLEFSMPTFRAWIFLSLFVLHQSFGICREITFVLLTTVLICLVIVPTQSFSVSAYLSFAAVIGIVWSLRLSGVVQVKKLWSKVKINFVVCMGAFLWTAPLISYSFEQVNVISFAYNFFLVPTLGVAMIVSSILFHIFLMLKISWLLIIVAKVQTMVTKVFILLVQMLSEKSLGLVSTDWVGKWAIYALFGSLIITYLYLENQSKKQKIIKINL